MAACNSNSEKIMFMFNIVMWFIDCNSSYNKILCGNGNNIKGQDKSIYFVFYYSTNTVHQKFLEQVSCTLSLEYIKEKYVLS